MTKRIKRKKFKNIWIVRAYAPYFTDDNFDFSKKSINKFVKKMKSKQNCNIGALVFYSEYGISGIEKIRRS